MVKFVLGFVVGIAVLLLAAFLWVRMGFVNPQADIPEGALEKGIAMPALDAAVDRHAPETANPVQPTDDNLLAGMKIYQANCASCHGDVQRPEALLAGGLYPRAPQFLKDPADMPENQNFYIIEHGVRLSGMPAWHDVLNQQEAWQVTTFLSHMDKLPPQVTDQWKALAGEAQPAAAPAPESRK